MVLVKKMIEVRCKTCKKKFNTYRSSNQIYCSRECFWKAKVFVHNISHTEEAKENMRKNYNSSSKETQFKKGHKFYKGGEKGWFKKGQHPKNWQGGKRTLSQKIKDDVRWKPWRESVFKRDNYTCQDCGERGHKLHPHHLKPKVKYIELAFDIDNGLTLCENCHKKRHAKNISCQ